MSSSAVVDRWMVNLLLRGLVQGQGIRPTIARMAVRHGVAGTVQNSFRGVEVTAIGEPGSLQSFQDALIAAFDRVSLVAEASKCFDERLPKDFRIVASNQGDRLQTTIPLDLGVCCDCLRDVRSPNNRRFGYPLTTCARCGPRYSIIKRMPFDRDSTSIAAFPMCEHCESEYSNPSDRRFHAQTIACPSCGPICWATDSSGSIVEKRSSAIKWIGQQIACGKIAAVKGIGGYQLICDATNDDAVRRLRERKKRPGKPLPVMVGDTAAAEAIAEVSPFERETLRSSVNPIVLLRSLEGNGISHAVTFQLKSIGVMLPTSPMHAMLIDVAARPLVVTSGNVHGSPLIYQNDIAEAELCEIADVFLHHDRDIIHPIDDSVVQCFGDQVTTIRAARGIAPMTIATQHAGHWIAVGGHQKVSPAISTENEFVLAPYVGDMDSESCRIRFQDSMDRLQSLYEIQPRQLIRDSHPDYFTSAWANERERPTSSVHHHHAHVAAAMLEHELLNQTVLGLAFDGTGFGDDETIWGGEALLVKSGDYERVGHLRRFRLPGGEHAIKHPRRITQSLLSQLGDASPVQASLQYAIDHGPVTSSMGRLFDGVAALILDIETVRYEGEAAMQLESLCDRDEGTSYEFAMEEGSVTQFDWRHVLTAIRSDMHSFAPARIAMKFHRAVARLVVDIAARYDTVPCVVAGGVFQNRLLLELIQSMAAKRSLDIRLPGRIPINDGGLAIGQLVAMFTRQHQPTAGSACV
jgi:hydrogenase maturation protein HypF